MDKKIIATNFGPNNGTGYYETNHYDDVIEITYVSEIDVVLWPGEYANLEHYLESPECDEYLTTKTDIHEYKMKTAEEIFAKYELKDQNGEGTDCLWYDDALLAMEEYAEQQVKLLATPDVSGSALLPDGWKVYKCTDCKEISVKKDNGEITVGFCDNCEHPLWND